MIARSLLALRADSKKINVTQTIETKFICNSYTYKSLLIKYTLNITNSPLTHLYSRILSYKHLSLQIEQVLCSHIVLIQPIRNQHAYVSVGDQFNTYKSDLVNFSAAATEDVSENLKQKQIFLKHLNNAMYLFKKKTSSDSSPAKRCVCPVL